MTEREEAIALIAAGMRKLGELSEAIATISTAARLIAEDLDAVERALILVAGYVREGRPEESEPAMLLRLCQRHMQSLVAGIAPDSIRTRNSVQINAPGSVTLI